MTKLHHYATVRVRMIFRLRAVLRFIALPFRIIRMNMVPGAAGAVAVAGGVVQVSGNMVAGPRAGDSGRSSRAVTVEPAGRGDVPVG